MPRVGECWLFGYVRVPLGGGIVSCWLENNVTLKMDLCVGQECGRVGKLLDWKKQLSRERKLKSTGVEWFFEE